MDEDLGEVSHDYLVVEFSGEVFEWRGPAPFHFVRVPENVAEEIGEEAARISYGWGMIPGVLTLGDTRWYTSLWPKDGGYLVPLKDAVRRAEGVQVGDEVSLSMIVGAKA